MNSYYAECRPKGKRDGKKRMGGKQPAMKQPAPPAPTARAMPPAAMPPVAIQPIVDGPMAMPPVGEPPMAMPPVGEPPMAMPPMGEPLMAMPPMAMPPMAMPLVAVPPMAMPPMAMPPGAVPPGAVPPVMEAPMGAEPECTLSTVAPRVVLGIAIEESSSVGAGFDTVKAVVADFIDGLGEDVAYYVTLWSSAVNTRIGPQLNADGAVADAVRGAVSSGGDTNTQEAVQDLTAGLAGAGCDAADTFCLAVIVAGHGPGVAPTDEDLAALYDLDGERGTPVAVIGVGDRTLSDELNLRIASAPELYFARPNFANLDAGFNDLEAEIVAQECA